MNPADWQCNWDMPTIAVVGPGAIGGMLAAWLCQNEENDVLVCARTPLRRIEVETPEGILEAVPEVLLEPKDATEVDWVLVCVKTYQVAESSSWLERLVGEHTRVAVVQNGVEHVENLSPYVPVERILPVMIACPVERLSPEKILQRAAGRMVVPVSEIGEAFQGLFQKALIKVTQDADFKTEAWRKLCLNAAGAVMALTDVPARVSTHPDGDALIRSLARECFEVARAEGAVLDESVVDWVSERYRAHDPDSVHSLHADMRAGRPMEIQARNGIIVERGKRHGIPTPYNDMATRLMRAAAEG